VRLFATRYVGFAARKSHLALCCFINYALLARQMRQLRTSFAKRKQQALVCSCLRSFHQATALSPLDGKCVGQSFVHESAELTCRFPVRAGDFAAQALLCFIIRLNSDADSPV